MGEKSTQADELDAERKKGETQEDRGEARAASGPRDAGSGQASGIAVSDPGVPGTQSAGRIAVGDIDDADEIAEDEHQKVRHDAAMASIQNIRRESALLPEELADTGIAIREQGVRGAGGGGGGIAIDEEGVQRVASGDLDTDRPPNPSAASSFNSSKSNVYREGGQQAGEPPEPSETSNLNLSKSNVDRQGGAGVGGPPEPVESANLNLSKSNIDRQAGDGSGQAPSSGSREVPPATAVPPARPSPGPAEPGPGPATPGGGP